MYSKYEELLQHCKETQEFVQKEQQKMFSRLFSGVAYDIIMRGKERFGEDIENVNIEEEAIKWLERIILPALKEEANRNLHSNDERVTVSVILTSSDKVFVLNMHNFGKERIAQEDVYYGKYFKLVMNRVIEILRKLSKKGSSITGVIDEDEHSWIFTCPIKLG